MFWKNKGESVQESTNHWENQCLGSFHPGTPNSMLECLCASLENKVTHYTPGKVLLKPNLTISRTLCSSREWSCDLFYRIHTQTTQWSSHLNMMKPIHSLFWERLQYRHAIVFLPHIPSSYCQNNIYEVVDNIQEIFP